MSDGMSDYWKAKRIENIVTAAANATARAIQRPDLDKTATITISGKKYKLKVDKVELVYHEGSFGAPLDVLETQEIPVLDKFEVKE
jgi:hypothetical protein